MEKEEVLLCFLIELKTDQQERGKHKILFFDFFGRKSTDLRFQALILTNGSEEFQKLASKLSKSLPRICDLLYFYVKRVEWK